MRHRVAVYGSLKRGCHNSHLLRNARFIGTDRLSCLTLYDLGPYPGARLRPSRGVEVEIYDVNDKGLAALDELEGYNPRQRRTSLYQRRRLATRYGTAWVYLYNQPVRHHQRMEQGVW